MVCQADGSSGIVIGLIVFRPPSFHRLLALADPSQRLGGIGDGADLVLVEKCGIGEIGCGAMKSGEGFVEFLGRVLVEDDFRPNAPKGRLKFDSAA